MKKLRWQIIVVLLALAAIAVLLLIQQPQTPASSAGGEVPIVGGVYTEALIGSLGRLNPLLDYYNAPDYDVDRLLYSGLIRFDHRGLPHGDLAETWGISKDGKSYNFSIRPDAYWHDGQPVVAEDIVFTVELMRDDRVPLPPDLHAFWDQVDVAALDEKTLQFRLPEAFSPFLDYLAFGVLPSHALRGVDGAGLINTPFNLSPIGSGPYRLESVETEGESITGLTLQVFPDYYGDLPYLEKIVFKYYADETSALAAYEAGDVLGVSRIGDQTLSRALRLPNLNLFTGRLPRLTLIYFNLNDPGLPFFQDAQVRRALYMGVNRRWIIDRLMGGQAIPAHGPIFPESWAYYEGIEQVGYDRDAAIRLLKDAGYTVPAESSNTRSKDGVELAFELVYPDTELFGKIAEQIRQDWIRLGALVDLKPVPYDVLISDYLEPRKYQAVLAEINFARSPDPDPYPFWHQAQISNGQNYSLWDDRQVSEYLEQARVLDDFAERLKRYRNFQVRFAQELPALTLFYPVYSYGVDNQVNGVTMGPLYDPSDRFSSISEWYLRTGSGRPAAQATPAP